MEKGDSPLLGGNSIHREESMLRKVILFTATLLLLLVISVASVGATSPPTDVEFVADIDFSGGVGSSFGPFTASGPAVDEGLMCESGMATAMSSKVSGAQSNTGFNVQVTYAFTCDDGSGEFFIKLQVRIDQKGDNFNWVVVGGNGDYEKLHGTGSGIGFPLGEGRVLDVYDGWVHID
jgi:hypothetical protein